MKTKDYKDLIVYQKAYDLALEIYKITRDFPKEEQFGLISQMRRAAISVPSNIAEGYRRKTKNEYVQFLHISYGSLGELKTQLEISNDLGFISKENFETIMSLESEVSKLLNSIILKMV